MACIIPVTRSAGFLFMDYNHVSQGLPHRTHVRLSQVADPLDPITMFAEANAWSGYLAAILSNKFNVVGWGTQDIDGAGLLQGTFGVAIPGSHSIASGAEDYRARTVTFVGRGVPASVGLCKGPALSRVFVGDGFNFAPGQRFISAGVDSALDDLALWFASTSVAWFDYYGQKAGVRTTYPSQFHAYIQKRYGQ